MPNYPPIPLSSELANSLKPKDIIYAESWDGFVVLHHWQLGELTIYELNGHKDQLTFDFVENKLKSSCNEGSLIYLPGFMAGGAYANPNAKLTVRNSLNRDPLQFFRTTHLVFQSENTEYEIHMSHPNFLVSFLDRYPS